jgi:alpha-amylase
MYQAFEWYTPSDPHTPNHSHWSYLRTQLPHLSALGISTLWLPPGCKAGNPHGNGYDIYDLWDLGEFDWKGQRPTKWGSKEELVSLCRAAREHRIGVIWDAVLNHRSSADFCEEVLAVPVSAQDRTKEIGREREILAWTRFDFPARKGRYSGLRLTKEDFNAIDWDDKRKERGIFRWSDRRWASDVDGELGNYDFL